MYVSSVVLKRWIVEAWNMIERETKRRELTEDHWKANSGLFDFEYFVSRKILCMRPLNDCVKTMKHESKLGIWLGEKGRKGEGWWKYYERSLEGESKSRSLRFRILCFTKNFMYASLCVKTMNRRSLEYNRERNEKERVGNIMENRWKANQNPDLFDFKYFVSRKILCTRPLALKRWIWLGKGRKGEGWWKYHVGSLESEPKSRSLRFRILCFTKNFM